MSTPVGGGGGVRPLQPVTQQPPAQQQQVGNKPQAPQSQTPARAGSALNNVNNFSSQPVTTDLEQLQQWLNGLKNKDQPAPQQAFQEAGGRPQGSVPEPKPLPSPAQPTQPSAPPQQIQTENRADQTSHTEVESKPDTDKPPPPELPKELDSTQKKRLHTGIKKLADKVGIKEADFARLAHAKASGNDAYYNFQLGKLDIPPTSAKGRLLEAGLEKLFSAIKAPGEAIADQVSKLVVIDDVSRLAKAANIAPSLAVDLGALTYNEQDRFVELAQATGVPKEKAIKLLDGFEKLGEQYDLDARELDESLGNASAVVNASLSQAMKKEAGKLGLPLEVFNDLANAVLVKDTAKFIEIGARGGLSRGKIQALLPQITRGVATLRAKPAFTGEKILRHTRDTMVQRQLEGAGRNFGLSGEQSLQLVAALVDGGLSGYVDQAKEFGLERNSQDLLNMFESVEAQHGKGALSLSTNNIDSIVSQRKMMKELGLQTTPIQWRTTKPAPEPGRGPFGPIGEIGSIFEEMGNSNPETVSNSALNAARNQNEVRYVLLTDKVQELDGQIDKLRKIISPMFMLQGSQFKQKLNNLVRLRDDVVGQMKKIEQAGFKPAPERVQEIKNAQKINDLKEKVGKMENLAKTNPLSAVLFKPQISVLKTSIQDLKQSPRA
ncbi:hypothetical protein M3P05_10545 [Sansalvadorimonas sp. 2012CJ34-2]|uniref:Uncharacterized protein n=1 Tax=Parendozoicomonas callyspongiae TaxID=2942213 RepID=A0ABT0PIP8_9GAMM|nr:hypothetical protein [Sansalvadorimonas sp. 2012CJ34-2]MCL6270358.1 hypothetical protein [Sansalvadorimonas sp. 2012CJ34-2]